jgi:hypothetical protein
VFAGQHGEMLARLAIHLALPAECPGRARYGSAVAVPARIAYLLENTTTGGFGKRRSTRR